MSAEENKALVRRFLEDLARGNLDVIDELLSPDLVDRSLLPGQEANREGYKRSMAGFRAPSLISARPSMTRSPRATRSSPGIP